MGRYWVPLLRGGDEVLETLNLGLEVDVSTVERREKSTGSLSRRRAPRVIRQPLGNLFEQGAADVSLTAERTDQDLDSLERSGGVHRVEREQRVCLPWLPAM